MTLTREAPRGLSLDLGCGAVKKEGTIGIDIHSFPGVDCVLNLESQPLPFADQSVGYVYSSHFLEHISSSEGIFAEVGRVCQDGAKLELWTPYAWHNEALVLGHRYYFTEEVYLHICVLYSNFWQEYLKSRWVLNEIRYIISEDVLAMLSEQHISVDFAVKHWLNIVKEFCVDITVLRHTPSEPPPPFKRTYSTSREGERHDLTSEVKRPPAISNPPPRRLRRLIPQPLKRLIKSMFYPG